MKNAEQRLLFESGNELAAYAAKQINYHVMGYYPITPSTQIAEYLDQMGADGAHDAEGFKIIWRYFAWCNQTLSVFTLWAITVYLVREKKNYYITLLPALMMTLVCSTYICIAPEGLSLPQEVAYGGTCLLVALIWFNLWLKKETQKRL